MEIEKLQESALNVIYQTMENFTERPNLALSAAKFFLMNFRIENKPVETLYDLEQLDAEEKPVFIEMLDRITVKKQPIQAHSKFPADLNQLSIFND